MEITYILPYFIAFLLKYSHGNTYKNAQTQCANVQGLKRQVVRDDGVTKNVFEYNNIPYARPPTGNNRWKPPRALTSSSCWTSLLQYSTDVIRCPQKVRGTGEVVGQEDCLVLDIRTRMKLNNPKPVVVWIHGGAMMYGHKGTTGYTLDSQLMASLDVVVVNVNYRLNMFGFLSLEELWITSGNKESYGNYGLMDIIQALEFLQINAKYFGGDRNKITIFGQSAGATGVNALLTSPPAQGLFHKAITASGAVNIRINHTQADGMFRSFVEDTGCDLSTQSLTKACLKALTVEEVMSHVPWFEPTGSGIPALLDNLQSYKFYFPSNAAVSGFPTVIIDPVYVPQSPDDFTNPDGDTIDVLLSNTAEEIPVYPPITLTSDMSSLRSAVETKIQSFNSASYDDIYDVYDGDNTFQPSTLTPSYLYSVMSTDVMLSCGYNDLKDHLASIGYNVYRLVVSQQPTPFGGDDQRASHEWDMRALFGYTQEDEFGDAHTPSADDVALTTNIRQYYQYFIDSDTTYKNMTAVLWNNAINTPSEVYHREACEFWRNNGFLTQSWGNTGV